MPIITIENTRADHYRFFKLFCLHLLKKNSWFLLLFTFIISYNISRANKYTWWQFIALAIVIFAVCATVYFFLLLLVCWMRFKSLVNSGKTFPLERKTAVISDDTIIVKGTQGSITFPLDGFSQALRLKEFIYLRTARKRAILFQTQYFNSIPEAEIFYEKMQMKINRNTPGKTNYSSGWLCLIPLIGFFAGLSFLLRGIKTKDRRWLLTGTGGLIFTPCVYLSLMYYTDHSANARASYREISRQNLSAWVKNIEYYKLQHNSYPDSLEMIPLTEAQVPLADPLYTSFLKPVNIKFYYKKIGEKYTLFSYGDDRIPNTADDIYPKELSSNDGHLGLIHL